MTYISESMRRRVMERASGRCEYFLLHSHYAVNQHEIDHIRAEKHGGTTEENNLCLSCFDCNRHKGSDLSSVDPVSGDVVLLFNPREDQWAEHFKLNEGYIEALTAKGRVTVYLLQLNDEDRVDDRKRLIEVGLYP